MPVEDRSKSAETHPHGTAGGDAADVEEEWVCKHKSHKSVDDNDKDNNNNNNFRNTSVRLNKEI